MAKKITTRTENFPQWYQDIIAAAPDLYDEAPVTGCITFGPLATALWANIRGYFDHRIKQLGVENIMVPFLVPEHFFEREKEHIEGFSPEVAVVTHAGGEKLSEPYYIRPTSELLFVDWFSQGRVQSYRDLPLLVNQWCSVIRWEKRPRAFLRTSEFHWQEGHCLFSSEEQCREFTLKILDEYTHLSESLLSIPVVRGDKPAHERFPGALDTYTIEGMMQDGKALQMGTSHVLDQQFLMGSDGKPMVTYLDEKGDRIVPYYDSWGISTRLIGALFMAHGDDDGIVLPPAVAPVSAAVLPILAGDDAAAVREAAIALAKSIAGSDSEPYALHGRDNAFAELPMHGWGDGSTTHSVRIDLRNDVRLGDKTFHQIHAGTPVRIEIGAKDLANKSCVIKSRIRSRDDAQTVPLENARDAVLKMLAEDQAALLTQARERAAANIMESDSYDEVKEAVAAGKWVSIAWDGSQETVDKLKADTSGGTFRCFPFDAPEDAKGAKDPLSGQESAHPKRILVAKAY